MRNTTKNTKSIRMVLSRLITIILRLRFVKTKIRHLSCRVKFGWINYVTLPALGDKIWRTPNSPVLQSGIKKKGQSDKILVYLLIWWSHFISSIFSLFVHTSKRFRVCAISFDGTEFISFAIFWMFRSRFSSKVRPLFSFLQKSSMNLLKTTFKTCITCIIYTGFFKFLNEFLECFKIQTEFLSWWLSSQNALEV